MHNNLKRSKIYEVYFNAYKFYEIFRVVRFNYNSQSNLIVKR